MNQNVKRWDRDVLENNIVANPILLFWASEFWVNKSEVSENSILSYHLYIYLIFQQPKQVEKTDTSKDIITENNEDAEVTKNSIEKSLVEPPIINVLDENHHTVIYKLSGKKLTKSMQKKQKTREIFLTFLTHFLDHGKY